MRRSLWGRRVKGVGADRHTSNAPHSPHPPNPKEPTMQLDDPLLRIPSTVSVSWRGGIGDLTPAPARDILASKHTPDVNRICSTSWMQKSVVPFTGCPVCRNTHGKQRIGP